MSKYDVLITLSDRQLLKAFRKARKQYLLMVSKGFSNQIVGATVDLLLSEIELRGLLHKVIR
jgi:hypothetical protein